MPTSGPNFPSTGADDASIGTASWTSPGNITSSNDVRASNGSVATSHYLKATGFGFAIPSGSHIRGVKLEIEFAETVAGLSNDDIVKLLKAGTVSGNNKGSIGIPTSEAFSAYGGDGDLWGLTLTPADVNNANFGAVLSITNTSGKESHGTVNVDSMRITIYYDPPDHGFFLRILGQ